jgi:type II secretory pathway pseudopilin PulG
MHQLKPNLRGAFTFLEVLFAVMILGIGMIMVAAMFPAGIRQTQANVEDSAYMALTRNMARQMQQMAADTLPTTPAPPAGFNHAFDYYLRPWPIPAPVAPQFQNLVRPKVYSFHDPRAEMNATRAPLWNWVRGNLVLQSDSTYGYVPLFSRAYNSGAANVDAAYNDQASVTLFILPLRARNTSTFSVSRDTNAGTGTGRRVTRLDPVLVNVAITLTPVAGTSTVTVSGIMRANGSPAPLPITAQNNPIEEGAYLVLSDMTGTLPPNGAPASQYNGSVYRIGYRQNSNVDTVWYLAQDPANSGFPGIGSTVSLSGWAFVVGRGPSAANLGPSNTFLTRSGPIQELGVVPTMISVTLK